MKTYKFQLTYPYIGDKVYQSNSRRKAINKCYREFKQFSDIDQGVFAVTDHKSKTEYTFAVTKHKKTEKNKVKQIKNKNKQKGGQISNDDKFKTMVVLLDKMILEDKKEFMT